MAVLSQLDTSSPAGSDQRSGCPAEIREWKQALVDTFPNADGAVLTSSEQFNNLRYLASQYGALDGPYLTDIWDQEAGDPDDFFARRSGEGMSSIRNYFPGTYTYTPSRITFSLVDNSYGGQAYWYGPDRLNGTAYRHHRFRDVTGAAANWGDLEVGKLYNAVYDENVYSFPNTWYYYRILNFKNP